MRELGLPGFLAFQLMVGGNALSALVHPLFMGGLIYALASGGGIWRSDNAAIVSFGALYGATAVIGYLISAFLGWLGLVRRGMPASAWVLVLTPLHWLLLSFAAWRAIYQLAVAPYTWEKTEHGLAKTSHRAVKLTSALIELEQELRELKDSGGLPVIGKAAPDWLAYRQRRNTAGALTDRLPAQQPSPQHRAQNRHHADRNRVPGGNKQGRVVDALYAVKRGSQTAGNKSGHSAGRTARYGRALTQSQQHGRQ